LPQFGDRSLKNLAGVHPDLRRVLDEAIKHVDFTVIQGQRGRAAQEKARLSGNSKAGFGQSPHNYAPALAVDVIPYPFHGWDDKDIVDDLRRIAGVVISEGKCLGVKITWGGNWRSFKDWPHLELTNWRSIRGRLAK
jgi:hypothetical protein